MGQDLGKKKLTRVWGVPQASPTAARGAAQGQRGGQGPGGSLWPRGRRCLSVHDATLGSVPGGWSQSVQMGHQEAKFRYLLLLPGAGGGDPLCSPRVGARGDGWDGEGKGRLPPHPGRAWAWAGWPWMPAMVVEGTWHHHDPLPSRLSPRVAANDHGAQKSLTQPKSGTIFL